MNLLFIQGGSRWKFDSNNNVYTDSNFNEKIWSRYKGYCENLTVILRYDTKIYSEDYAKEVFNKFPVDLARYVSIIDLYRPALNILKINLRKKIKKEIEKEIKAADKVIIRSLGNIYTNTAIKYAMKYNKPYIVEVTGFAWESLWYHSFRGKVVAIFKEFQYKRLMKKVEYATYVTNEALQKRYPCKGIYLGCSDVELLDINEDILLKRINKINNIKDKIIIGTAAFLDVRWKGQEYVIKAIAKLKNEGIDNFEYHIIGSGTGTYLKKIIKQLNVEDRVKIIGSLSHEKVYEWMDSIDIYIQPSFSEGLCRSIVEAMSRACPIICSNVGGNYELIEKKCLFKKGNYNQLSNILKNMINKKELIIQAKRNFNKSKEYDKEILDFKRDKFYIDFIENS